MSGEFPSEAQNQASQAQSEADRTGKGKAKASAMQSKADHAAVRKHGL
ncbi:hypothetical protein ACFFSY_07865 [Paenibacillus aurantiacus]|uniref:Uncharacterized protein n=1 Tax=Paenibacillus aurantiacus TaxID=1936118 RepID=A0ABV5KKU2_9BACL